MGHHHHFHFGHVFHSVEHIVADVAHVAGGVVGEAVETAIEGKEAFDDFKHHHDLAGVVSGAKALEGGASLLGLL